MLAKLMRKKSTMIFCVLFCCSLWAISTPIVKIGYNYVDDSHVPSLLLWAGVQFIVAGILTIGIYSIFTKKLLLPKKESFKGIAVVSLLQTVLQYSFLYIGLSQTTAVKGAILKCTDVFFVALIASLIFKMEKLTLKKLFCCGIGFIGIIVMNLDGLTLKISLMGDGLVVAGVLAYSFSVVITNLVAQKENSMMLCGYQMSFGGVILLIIGILFKGRLDIMGMLPVLGGLSLIYAVAYNLWTVLLKYHSPSTVTVYSFMSPILGVIFSSLILSEDSGVSNINLIIALGLVCAGIILWDYQKKPKVKAKK
jgi:drug/metabolite transporter (DMT)-like permease